MSQPDDALDVLRAVWSAEGQTSTDLDEACGTKSCKKMADVGFDGLAGAGGDPHAAWRGSARSWGEANPQAQSLRGPSRGPPHDPRPARTPRPPPDPRAPR